MKNMKSPLLYLLVLFVVSSALVFPQGNYNLMPVPSSVQNTEGQFRLSHTFSASVLGNPDKRIYPGITRTLRRISGRTGLFFPQDFITSRDNDTSAQLLIFCERPGKVQLNENESYSLEVRPAKIILTSKTDLGTLRGLETLYQLLSSDQNGYFFPAVIIEDVPRFPWRGLMIDVSRHFMPVDVIKRNLDAMAALKMNVFHWHLSDDQGFRVECKTFPKLHELGSDGFYFTQTQIQDVIQYAADRGIRVIPEFDIPGHSTAWFTAVPELASAPGPYKIERRWGIFDPVFNPTLDATYEFFDKFLKEMTALFPDPYFHIGGDENNGKQWKANPQIQAFMQENKIPDNHALQAYFNNRILKILTKYDKKMIGWDEILHPDMPNNIVIQSWRGTDALVQSAKKGYMGILSNGYYIDLIQPASFHYLNDPVPSDTLLNEKETSRILGGEATSWAELVTPENVDSRIWPRTAAIAERFWSPKTVRDVEDMYRRMDRISFLLEDYGITHRKNHDMMLRRLADNNDVTYLKRFIEVIEPVKNYNRHFQGVTYTQHSPYTRTVDAAMPESNTARIFNKLVTQYLEGNKAVETELKSYLTLWKDNHSKLQDLIRLSPILKEIEPLSENLMKASAAALESLVYLQYKRPVDKKWLDNNLKLIEEAKKPFGQTELMIIPGIEKLISAAGKQK